MSQIEKKVYAAPMLVTFGRMEELTRFYTQPTARDNSCPGGVGSVNVNSGLFCIGGGNGEETGTGATGEIVSGNEGTTVEEIIIPVIPTLPGEDLVGGSASGG